MIGPAVLSTLSLNCFSEMLERKVLEEKSLRPMSELYEICEGNKKSN